jgi:hypothetical protein
VLTSELVKPRPENKGLASSENHRVSIRKEKGGVASF